MTTLKSRQGLKGISFLLLTAAIFVGMTAHVSAATLWVDPSWQNEGQLPSSVEMGISGFYSIGEALSAAQPGDVLVLNPGLYENATEQFPIVVDKPVAIVSAQGAETTRVIGAPMVTVFEVTSEGVQIIGLTIEHTGNGLLVFADDVHISNNRIVMSLERFQTSSCGLWLAGAFRTHVENNQFMSCGVSMAGPYPVSDADGSLPRFTGLYEVGHDSDYFSTHFFEGNLVNGRPLLYLVGAEDKEIDVDAGQIIIAEGKDIVITSSHISQASIGILVAHSQRVRIVDSQVDENGLFGIGFFYSEACSIENTMMSGNNHGIDIRVCYDSTVERCLVTDNGQGVFFALSNLNTIRETKIAENGVGLYMYDSDEIKIFKNEAKCNSVGMYASNSRNITFTNNRLRDNSQAALRISGQCESVALIDNLITGNGTGVLFWGADTISIENNLVFENNITGIYLADICDTFLSGNIIFRNPIGIRLVDSCLKFELCSNTFLSNDLDIKNDARTKLDE